jgi:hypothetical protein
MLERAQVSGRDYTHGGFYRGFGLYNSVFLVFAAVLAWRLGTLATIDPKAIGVVGWALCLTMVASLIPCWADFNMVAVTFSAVLALLLGWAAWLVQGLATQAH